MGRICDFWGLSGSHDAALSVVAARDANSSTGESTPSSVDLRKAEIRRPCITRILVSQARIHNRSGKVGFGFSWWSILWNPNEEHSEALLLCF